jgi:hypothetical protein
LEDNPQGFFFRGECERRVLFFIGFLLSFDRLRMTKRIPLLTKEGEYLEQQEEEAPRPPSEKGKL